MAEPGLFTAEHKPDAQATEQQRLTIACASGWRGEQCARDTTAVNYPC
jgi:hypothetical protein